VMALLQAIGSIPRKHQGAISHFDREFVHTGFFARELSADLHRAFEARQEGDYQSLEPVALEVAAEALQTAERFVKAVQEYLGGTGMLPAEP